MSDPIEVAQQLCPQCAKEIDADARFCKYCAFELTQLGTTQTNQNKGPTFGVDQNPTRRNLPLIVGGVVCVVVILIGLVALLAYFKLRNSSATSNSNSSQPSATMSLSANGLKAEEKILRGEALNQSDIEGLSNDELRIVRNVHFARYGRKFDRPGLGDYFSTRPWYDPNDSYADTMLNATDKANVDLIVRAEKGEGSAGENTPEDYSEENDDTGPNPGYVGLDGEAYDEVKKVWAKINTKCGESYFWRKQTVYSGVIEYSEGKGEPMITVDGKPIPPKDLTAAQKMNGIDPQPVEWAGSAKVRFNVGRFFACAGNCVGDTKWQDNYIAFMTNIRKEKGKWNLYSDNDAVRYPSIKCSDLPK